MMDGHGALEPGDLGEGTEADALELLTEYDRLLEARGMLHSPHGAFDEPAPKRMRTAIIVEPLGDRVVVMPSEIEDTVEEQFALPGESAKERPQVAKVLAVGPGRRHPMTGELLPVAIRVGQDILHARYAGKEITVEGKTFLILLEDECMAVMRREEVEDTSEPITFGLGLPTTEPKGGVAALNPNDWDVTHTCIDESHGNESAIAAFKVDGPHGELHYCAEHAKLYEKTLTDLGHVITLTPIERG